jgi:prepilin-type N-terminal cleavage/methylation domain-containing protein
VSASVVTPRPGVTLVELLVVIVILGLCAGVAAMAVQHTGRSNENEVRVVLLARLAGARREALRTGRAITITHADSAGVGFATALPDGSIIGDSLVVRLSAVDRLSGRTSSAAANAESQP